MPNNAAKVQFTYVSRSTYDGLTVDGNTLYSVEEANGDLTLYLGSTQIGAKTLHSHTFASLTGKPTTLVGYGITDAMSTNHPANAITGVKIANWDTAYGWGNHASAGYLTSESDPVFTAWDKSTGISITEAQISDFGSYLPLSGGTVTGGLTISGSVASGGSDYGYYQSVGTNIVLKGDALGRSGIFFQSEKDGTNINHPSDYGFIQFHSYGFNGSSGESNVLAIGVANDSTDMVVLQSPYSGGVKLGFRNATSGTGLTLETVASREWMDASGNAASATQLETARTINVGTGVSGTATAFDGSGNITIPINSISESYLSWGGKNLVGDVTPIGMAISNEHSANKLAFINGDSLYFEYSADGGSTWADYGFSATQKSQVCTTSLGVLIGRTSGEYTTLSRTRVTLTAQNGSTAYVYTNPRKMLVNISSSGAMQVLVEYRTGTNYLSNGAWNTYGTYSLSGWSGWNDIPLILGTLGGGTTQTGNNWQLRLTFIMTSKNTTYPTTAQLNSIRIYGSNSWVTPSTMALTGNLYSFDMSQNAYFPGEIREIGQRVYSPNNKPSWTDILSKPADGTVSEVTIGTETGQRIWSPSILKSAIEALSINSFTNNYLTGVSGSGNGTVTFTRNGLADLTWNASHAHTFASLTSKPTTVSGYGITDAITTSNISSQSVAYATNAGSLDSLDSTAFLRANTSNAVDVRLTSGNGRGVRFWDSDSYKMWMSATSDTSVGGRIDGDTTSDYNMYFRMASGTNRGFVFESAYASKIMSINPTKVISIPNIKAPVFEGALSGNASTATKFATARTINGTSFDGSADITTSTWGTARTITIGGTGKSVNGGVNVSWSLAEIGAQAAGTYNTIIGTDTDIATLTGSAVVASLTMTDGVLTAHSTRNLDAVRGQDGTDMKFWKGTQAAYNAIGTKDSNTIYFVTG